jgi:HlyD family secretion protein
MAQPSFPVPPRQAPDPARGPRPLERELSRVGSSRWVRRGIVVIVLAIAIAGFMVWRAKTAPPAPAKYITAAVSVGDVLETVQSTGQVKPLTEVQVGAQVSGRVTKVHVDWNSIVKKGALLAEIDPSLIDTQLEAIRAQISAGTANLSRAEASLVAASQRRDRAKKLTQEQIGTQADLDAAEASYDVAIADVATAKAQITQLRAQLRSSQTNLDYTRVYSPIDGVVINRAIDPGQTVAASFQAPTLFVIAEDLQKMRVLADIDEADVGRLREGMAAEVKVDAFPGEPFKGTVSQVRFSPINVSGVVTYAAVILVDNPELKLRPGMTATVTIRSAEALGVKRLPNAALRYKPSPPLDKDGKAIPEPPLPPLAPRTGRIYVVTDSTLGSEKAEARVVDVGITDGVHTVVLSELGDAKVVTDEADAKKEQKLF